MPIYIETPRLVLRDWNRTDLGTFTRMNMDSRVMEFYPDRLSAEETAGFYGRIVKEFADFGYGLYAVERKEDGAFMGYTGFHNIPAGIVSGGVEIGWRLAAEYWNRGYATEAAAACLDYAAGHLPFGTVYSFTSVLNVRSERVMRKIGMRKEGEFLHPSIPVGHSLRPHVLYRIDL